MPIDILSTSDMLEVIRETPQDPRFFTDRFFGRTFFSDSEWIEFDEVSEGRRLAPFVAPNVQGQPMVERGYSAKRFKPAYVKPKNPVNPNRALRRRPGEALGGSLSPQQRIDAIIAELMEDHRNMIDRRCEWMAARAILDGIVVVEGENYPSSTVDFGRSANHTIALSGAALWSATGTAAVTANVKSWIRTVTARGRAPSAIVLGSNAAESFFAAADVKDMLDTNYRGGTASIDRYNFSGAPQVYHGRLQGESGVEVWTYSGKYEDNDGNEVDYMNPNDVLVAGDVGGVQAFGAIMDHEANYQSLRYFPKMWTQDDPSGVFILTQSAPLMIPVYPNATLRARVL